MPASAEFLEALNQAAVGRTIVSIAAREAPEHSDDDSGVRVCFEFMEGLPDWVEVYAQTLLQPDSRLKAVLTLAWPVRQVKTTTETET